MMKRCVAGLVLVSLASCKTVQGSGTSKTEKRDLGEFTTVVAASGVLVIVATGPHSPLEVTADDNLLAKVKTDVSGGKLKVSVDGNVEPKTPIVVQIAAPGIKEYDAESGATLKATGIAGDAVTLDAKSGAKLTATGTVDKITVDAASGATLDASHVTADSADAHVASGATASVQASKSASGAASSGAHLRVAGQPAKKDVSESSGGAVTYD
jgi:hypothetical protein